MMVRGDGKAPSAKLLAPQAVKENEVLAEPKVG